MQKNVKMTRTSSQVSSTKIVADANRKANDANKELAGAKKKATQKNIRGAKQRRIASYANNKAAIPISGFRGNVIAAMIFLVLLTLGKNRTRKSNSPPQTDGKKPFRKIKGSEMKGNVIIAMALPLASRVILAVMKLPRSYADRAITARAITNACNLNPLIVIPPLTIAAYLGAIDVLDADQTATKTRTIGTASTRNAQWIIVYNNLKALMAVAQAGANANQSQAIVIIESGLFKVKQASARKAKIFTAVNSGISGKANLSAPGGGRDATHEWQMSMDGISYTDLPNTRLSKTVVTGLKPVSVVWFRHRTVVGNVISVWEYSFLTVSA